MVQGAELSTNRSTIWCSATGWGTMTLQTCSGVNCRKPPADWRASSTSITMLPGGLHATCKRAGHLDTR
jgi:hypothetical protein